MWISLGALLYLLGHLSTVTNSISSIHIGLILGKCSDHIINVLLASIVAHNGIGSAVNFRYSAFGGHHFIFLFHLLQRWFFTQYANNSFPLNLNEFLRNL